MWSAAPGSVLAWGRRAALAVALVCAAGPPVAAQPRGGKPAKPPATKPAAGDAGDAKPAAAAKAGGGSGGGSGSGKKKEQNFNFEGLGLAGKNRSPQLLYFLERANEELERASLEKRSFIPHMVRSVEEEAL